MLATSVAYPGCLSRILDPTTTNRKEGKKLSAYFVAINFTKLKFNRNRKKI
jgi:hypothetical protein